MCVLYVYSRTHTDENTIKPVEAPMTPKIWSMKRSMTLNPAACGNPDDIDNQAYETFDNINKSGLQGKFQMLLRPLAIFQNESKVNRTGFFIVCYILKQD